jgi:hypothetical protein
VRAPSESFGGAEDWFASAPATLTRVASPWHEVQVIASTSTTPFMWVARLTVLAV